MIKETYDQEETEALGLSLGKQLARGDVILLRGELGAGKSVLARGIARGLGVKGPIQSPTFTLLNGHEGVHPLFHFDLYRLHGEDAFYEAGLAEYLPGDGIALVEWPGQCEGAMPPCHLDIAIAYGGEENHRIFTITPKGGFREVKP